MTRQEHLLTILIEECNETAQRATKALRFGMKEIQDGQPQTNAERIVYELNDIVATMELLYQYEYIERDVFDAGMVREKKAKIEKYLAYSEECGTLNENKPESNLSNVINDAFKEADANGTLRSKDMTSRCCFISKPDVKESDLVKCIKEQGGDHRLSRWANKIAAIYGAPVYLVGSNLYSTTPRDVDVCVILPDDDFSFRYGIGAKEYTDEQKTGMYSPETWAWCRDMIHKWEQGCKFTHLNLDFKVIPKSYAFEMYEEKPRLRLDSRP